jgi:hypothetical protein
MDDQEPEEYDEQDLVRTTVNLVPANLDKVFLSAASLNETPSEVINRAIAFYFLVMGAKRRQVIGWQFADGSRGRVRRLE